MTHNWSGPEDTLYETLRCSPPLTVWTVRWRFRPRCWRPSARRTWGCCRSRRRRARWSAMEKLNWYWFQSSIVQNVEFRKVILVEFRIKLQGGDSVRTSCDLGWVDLEDGGTYQITGVQPETSPCRDQIKWSRLDPHQVCLSDALHEWVADGDVALYGDRDRQVGRPHAPDVQQPEGVRYAVRERNSLWGGLCN